ncbi:MAG: hypothetical protein IJR85_01525 [Synergistaceae bacterium]|nr:hypothetical protein [Synergistaceae bacterium]
MNYEDEQEQELSLLDIFNTIWRRKWLIVFLTLLFFSVSLIRALLAPLTYRAECRIIPPQRGGSTGGGFLSQLGGLADFIGIPTGITSGRMMLGILKSDSVVDAIIEKFNLMEELSTDIRMKARTTVLAGLETNEDGSGIIGIAYISTSPDRAAEMANAFVVAMQNKMQELALIDAQQKRKFFEDQLAQAQQELTEAENEMIAYQQSKGVVALESQTGALLTSISNLRSRIASKNVEISAMKSYARQDNPKLRVLYSELEAMNRELRKLEEEQQKADRLGRIPSGDLFASIGQVPELGIEYQRYMRSVRFATTKYEMMLRQYENAKFTEANDLSTIQIVDPATPPDEKYGPKRRRMVLLGTAAGFVIGVFWAFLAEHINALRRERRRQEEHYYEDEDD